MGTTSSLSPLVTSASPVVDTQYFANNAFSNFAPLLTLFGDEITKQFLSTSMGWADSILLGVAPIGIMTVVVCAIRIGGNQFMKSFIGRARDSPDDEEKEILSSTSQNVREIWDGNRVIRQTGPAETRELVYDTKWQRGRMNEAAAVPLAPPLMAERMLDVLQNGKRVPGWPVYHDMDKKAPNITLNIENAIPKPWEVNLFMVSGILIQATVMVINALAVYYWKWPRAKSIVASYGYPIWAVGTLIIAIGVSICSRVVESSTTEFVITPRTKDQNPMIREEDFDCLRIIRLQRKISELNLPAYLIKNAENNNQIRVSFRDWRPKSPGEKRPDKASRVMPTIVGSILTLAGFVCQNVGTRELHWSAGILQLGATFLLAILRALLRRHVGDPPNPIPLALENCLEAAHLASHLESAYCYMPSEYGKIGFDITNFDGPRTFRDFNIVNPAIGQRREILVATDPQVHKINRMLNLHSTFSAFEPLHKDFADTASNLYSAINEILERIIGTDDKQPLAWSQHLVLKNSTGTSSVENILPLDIFKHISSPSPRAMIRAIITLTYYYRHSQTYKYGSLRIIGQCKVDDLEARKLQLQEWAGTQHRQIGSWMRDPTGQIREINLRRQAYEDGIWNVLGYRYSMLFQERYKTIDTNSECELVTLSGVQNEYEEEYVIAIDLFASFMMDLAIQKRAELAKFVHSNGGACDELARILMKHNLCNSLAEARLAIVPALIAEGIEVPKPPA
ncbi:hypothetical protein B0O99DRAFT_590550 [Bisporella sp. PMI_857]|nr:hypothetical protein B0O99DRAFT_590550 [Bisporella sp. PMI_857]